ncbi:MAG: extracellular solute-binding protein [Planctomycetes bacterium]|nr:extracellular solute-binding protein [Planctomycetota bacterium]
MLPYAGQEIQIGVPADLGFATAWEGPLNEWQAQAGAKYQLRELPRLEPGQSLDLFAGSDAPTLALFPLERAGELIAAGHLAPIPDSLRGDENSGLGWPDIFQGLRERVASRKSQPLFVPLSVPVLVCYYRQDLLEKSGLKPPQNWDDYQELLNSLGTWAPGKTAVEPWGESWRSTMFLARAVSGAQHPSQYSLFFDIETGAPLISGPAFVRALSGAQQALAKMPKDVLQYTPTQCLAELFAGRAALAIACEPAAVEPQSQGDSASAPVESGVDGLQVSVIRLPGSREVYDASRGVWEPLPDKGISQVTLTGFSGWGVGALASSSKVQVEAAWSALLKASGPDLVSGYPPTVIGLCRESQLQAGVLPATFSLRAPLSCGPAVAESLRNPRLVAELQIEGREEFRQVLAREVAAALSGSVSAEQALQTVANDWQKIIDRIGVERHRNNYRSSLGLMVR